jgi:hypothetical protein
MSVRRSIGFVLGVLLVVASACGGFLWYEGRVVLHEVMHLRIDVRPEQLSDAAIALKGSMGQAMFDGSVEARTIPGTGLDAVLQPAASPNSEGVLSAYKKNPEAFHRYARMFDTALSAQQVGKAVLRLTPARLPHDSSHLDMESASTLDAWGEPFCIVPLRGRVAIVSGGPSKKTCAALPLTRDQIAQSNRKVFAGPDDVVVVIVSHP